MMQQCLIRSAVMSASSWGCELKCIVPVGPHVYILSASSWGCELKWPDAWPSDPEPGQPLREAVSWNNLNPTYSTLRLWVEISTKADASDCFIVSLFVRLWVEIKVRHHGIIGAFVSLFVRLWVEIVLLFIVVLPGNRQPLCEAVSWNNVVAYDNLYSMRQSLREAVIRKN